MPKESAPSILFIPRFDTSCDDGFDTSGLSPADEPTQPANFTRICAAGRRLHYTPTFEQEKPTCATEQTINPLIDKGWRNEKRFYQILPDMSSKEQGWPQSTDIYCWWCCFPFETRPVPIAAKFHKSTFKVYGNFCSFNCAKAHLLNSNKNMTNMLSLNLFLYKKMTGSPAFNTDIGPPVIVPAPPREMLKIFGGPFSIEEFRESSLQLKEYKAYPFNCISINEHIEESVRLAIRAAGVSEDGLPPTETCKAKRKRKNNDGDIATKDLDLRARMEDAKMRLDTRSSQPSLQTVPSSDSDKKTPVKRPRRKAESTAPLPTVDTPVSIIPNKNPNKEEDAGSSEYVLDGMMGLKIIRREKKPHNKK